MKANGAPEKLYVSVGDAILDIYSKKESNEEIEYTRTDAFIEKALKWFKEHKNAIAVLGFIPDYYIEDFKKYIGE